MVRASISARAIIMWPPDSQPPERFELEYTGEDGQKHRPVMTNGGADGTQRHCQSGCQGDNSG